MSVFRTALPVLLAAALAVSGNAVVAQSLPPDPDGPMPPRVPPRTPTPTPPMVYPTPPVVPPAIVPPTDPLFVPTQPASAGGMSAATTGVIVAQIDTARDFCRRLARPEYTVDCLADRLDQVARSIPAGSEYADVRQVLSETSDRLAALARRNASPDLPRGRAKGAASDEATSRPITPVDTAALPRVSQEAERIIAEAETLLLRSAESSERRRVHYEAIAAAVGSNKVLLRSS